MYLPKIKLKLNHSSMEFLHHITDEVAHGQPTTTLPAAARANISVIQEIAHKFNVTHKRQKEYNVTLKYHEAYTLYYTITLLSNQPVAEEHQAYALAQYTLISSLLGKQLI